jgi:hypothetical protein
MDYVRLLMLLIALTPLLFLLLGLIRPWIMLWWEDLQNRLKVIKVYGTVAVICFLAYWVMGLF